MRNKACVLKMISFTKINHQFPQSQMLPFQIFTKVELENFNTNRILKRKPLPKYIADPHLSVR